MIRTIALSNEDLVKGTEITLQGSKLLSYKSDLKNRSNVAIGTDLGEYQITTPVTDGHWAPITDHETHRPIGWVLKCSSQLTSVKIFLKKD